MEHNMTGYPSIDKPWLKYYTEEAINVPMPEGSIFDFLYERNKAHLDDTALDYFGRKITYKTLFENIEKAAKGFTALGVKRGDIVIVATVTTPETIYAFYALNRIGAVSNMVDPRTSVEGLRDYIREVDARHIISLDACYPKMIEVSRDTNVKTIIVTTPADSLPVMKKAAYSFAARVRNGKTALAPNTVRWDAVMKAGANTNLVAG